jgi:hypothetical protein
MKYREEEEKKLCGENSQSNGPVRKINCQHVGEKVINPSSEYVGGSTQKPLPNTEHADSRALQETELNALIRANEKLDCSQKEQLVAVLKKYLAYMTTKPGECNVLEYKFNVEIEEHFVQNSRPVPYAIRGVVRDQIRQMLQDGIIETSSSPILNPLTIVYKANNKIRLCVDARRINRYIISDRERTQPIQELVQKFGNAKFMSSLDISSAFWQLKLHKDSRKYTAFMFDSTVYQFKRVPYGFKNSLSAFVRALKLALGTETDKFVVCYVDDLVVYSRTFEEHMKHLDYVLRKLTTAGFTLNAGKCRFCLKELKFLGHRISNMGVSADSEKIEAILNYPAPKNQKQLRQLLGTCNFHGRFIVGYANYIAPLLPLLKQGNRWKWTAEMQQAFEGLRASFASSIQLAHPREDLPYLIYTDASKLGISAILMQENEKGEKLVISTASRVLSAIEQKYSTCEQELLAVVYALQKFRIYVFGHKITLYSDNKALSFLKKCTLTSNRVTRWIMQIQEYDLQIVHISGTSNYFADILSRNPVGITTEQLNQVRKPKEILVAAINLNVDVNLKKELKDLVKLQEQDVKLIEIKQKIREF